MVAAGLLLGSVSGGAQTQHEVRSGAPRAAATVSPDSAKPALASGAGGAVPTPLPRERAPVPASSRAPGEWQGMPVDTSSAARCGVSLGCGLALACIEGRCGPCTADAECASGEACVLEHCVRAEHVSCRSRQDCTAQGDDALCVLSGLSDGQRGNRDLRAYCLTPSGGQRSLTSAEAPPPTWQPVSVPRASVHVSDLLKELREERP